jgi:RNA polymerase sigma-70 factor (ECF subfamily)
MRYDEEALGALYDEYAPLIYGYIYRRVGDGSLAEHLVGEVFDRALNAIRSEQAWRTSFRAWLYRTAHNVVVDDPRRRPDETVSVLELDWMAGELDTADALREKASRQRWLAAVQELTSDQQEVLTLRFGDGLTGQDTAEVMGKSISAVRSLQRQALDALRSELSETGEQRPPRRDNATLRLPLA